MEKHLGKGSTTVYSPLSWFAFFFCCSFVFTFFGATSVGTNRVNRQMSRKIANTHKYCVYTVAENRMLSPDETKIFLYTQRS